jgi:hypothetical protein
VRFGNIISIGTGHVRPIQSRITATGSYDEYNKPYLDFLEDVVETYAGTR